MTKKPMTVEKFIDDIVAQLHDKGQEEFEELVALKRQQTKDDEAVFNPWDYSFYENIQKEKLHLDEQEVKQYFPTDHVIVETQKIYQELLGLKFEPTTCSTWHEDVSCFTVADAESDELMGQFYLDLYPREGKYTHAACMHLMTRHNSDVGMRKHITAMVTNFDPPAEGKKATMSHDEVTTFFHEFGHIMHHMSQEVNYSLLNQKRGRSFGSETDFVEMPSQMLENWCWDKDILKRLSKHVETGAQLSDELIEKKIALKNHNGALGDLS